MPTPNEKPQFYVISLPSGNAIRIGTQFDLKNPQTKAYVDALISKHYPADAKAMGIKVNSADSMLEQFGNELAVGWGNATAGVEGLINKVANEDSQDNFGGRKLANDLRKNYSLEALRDQALDNTNLFVEGWRSVVESAPSTAATAGVGFGVGMINPVLGIAAAAAMEGAQSAGESYGNINQSIRDQQNDPNSPIRNSQQFKNALSQAEQRGLRGADAETFAFSEVAKEQAQTGSNLSGIANVAGSFIGGRAMQKFGAPIFEKAMKGPSKRFLETAAGKGAKEFVEQAPVKPIAKALSGAARVAPAEGLEEYLQSGAEMASQNYAIGQVDNRVGIMDNVPEAALKGGLAGLIGGAGFGGGIGAYAAHQDSQLRKQFQGKADQDAVRAGMKAGIEKNIAETEVIARKAEEDAKVAAAAQYDAQQAKANQPVTYENVQGARYKPTGKPQDPTEVLRLGYNPRINKPQTFDYTPPFDADVGRARGDVRAAIVNGKRATIKQTVKQGKKTSEVEVPAADVFDSIFVVDEKLSVATENLRKAEAQRNRDIAEFNKIPENAKPPERQRESYQRHVDDSTDRLAEATKAYRAEQAAARARTQKKANQWNAIAKKHGLPEVTFSEKPMTTAQAGPKGALVQTTGQQKPAAPKQPTEDDLYIEDAELETEQGRIGSSILNKNTPLADKQVLMERLDTIRARRAEIETQLAGMADQSQALDLSRIANEDGSINRDALNKNDTVKEASTMFQKPQAFEEEFSQPEPTPTETTPQLAEARRLIEEAQLPVQRTDTRTPVPEQQQREQKLTDDEIFEVAPVSTTEKIGQFNERAARTDGVETGSPATGYRIVRTKRGLHGTNIGKTGKTTFPTREAAEDWLADNAKGRNVNLSPEAVARKAERDKQTEEDRREKEDARNSYIARAGRMAYQRVFDQLEQNAIKYAKQAIERVGLSDRGMIATTWNHVTDYIRTINNMNSIDPRTGLEAAEYDSGNFGAIITAGTKENPLTLIAIHKNLIHPNMKPDEMKAVIDRTMNHELVHALVRGGFITPQEYSTLLRLVRKRKMPDPKTGKPGAVTYLDFQKAAYPNVSPAAQEEEAIAELIAIEGFGSSRASVGSEVRGILDRIVRVIKAMIGVFQDKDFRKFDNLMTAIKDGSVAKRVVSGMGIDPSNLVDPFGRSLSSRADMADKTSAQENAYAGPDDDFIVTAPLVGPEKQVKEIRSKIIAGMAKNNGRTFNGMGVAGVQGYPTINVGIKFKPGFQYGLSGKLRDGLVKFTSEAKRREVIDPETGKQHTVVDAEFSTSKPPLKVSDIFDLSKMEKLNPVQAKIVGDTYVLLENNTKENAAKGSTFFKQNGENSPKITVNGHSSYLIVKNLAFGQDTVSEIRSTLAHEIEHITSLVSSRMSGGPLAPSGSNPDFSLSTLQNRSSMEQTISSGNSYIIAVLSQAERNLREAKSASDEKMLKSFVTLKDAAKHVPEMLWRGILDATDAAAASINERTKSTEEALQAAYSVAQRNAREIDNQFLSALSRVLEDHPEQVKWNSFVAHNLFMTEAALTLQNIQNQFKEIVIKKGVASKEIPGHIAALQAVAEQVAQSLDMRHYLLENGEQNARGASEEVSKIAGRGIEDRILPSRLENLSNTNGIKQSDIDMAAPEMSGTAMHANVLAASDGRVSGLHMDKQTRPIKDMADNYEKLKSSLDKVDLTSKVTRADMRSSDQSNMSSIDGLNSGDVALLAKIMQDEPLLSIEQATRLLNEKKQSDRRPYRPNEVQGILNRLAKINEDLLRPGTNPEAIIKYEKLWGTDKLKAILTEAANGTSDGVLSKQFDIARSTLRAALNEMNIQPKDNYGGLSPELAAKRLPEVVINKASQMSEQGMGIKPLRAGEDDSMAITPEFSISSNGMLIRTRANSYVLQEMLRDSEDGGRGRTLGQIINSYRKAGYRGTNTAIINTFLEIEKKLRGNYDPDYYIGSSVNRADMAAAKDRPAISRREGVNKFEYRYKPMKVDEITEGKARANLSEQEYDIFDIVRNGPPQGLTINEIVNEYNKYKRDREHIEPKYANIVIMKIRNKNLPLSTPESEKAERTTKVLEMSKAGAGPTEIAKKLYKEDMAEMDGLTDYERLRRAANTVASIISQDKKKNGGVTRADMKTPDLHDRLAKMGYQNPMNGREFVVNGGAIEAYINDGKIWLKSLRAVERGGGKRALERLISDIADKEGMDITLTPEPFATYSGKEMSEEELRDWYSNFDFVGDPDSEGDMIRFSKPRPIKLKGFNRADMKVTAAAETVRAAFKKRRDGILDNAKRYAQNQTGDAILDQLASLHRIIGRAVPNAEKLIFEQIDSSEGLERIMQKYRAAGGKIDAGSMVALDNDANRGKTKPEIERVTTEAMEPVLTHINSLNVTQDMVTELGLLSDTAARWFEAQKENGRDKDSDLAYNAAGLYLLAKHAPYREAFIRSKKRQSAELRGGEGTLGIGIPLAEAGIIVEFFDQKLGQEQMATLSKSVQNAVNTLTKIREDGGLIPRGLSSMQFYVPARGFAERDGEEDLNFVTINPGSRGRTPLRQDPFTRGRLSLPDDPLTSLAQMIQVAIMRKNTNQTLNSLRRLIENNEGLFDGPGGPGIFVAGVTYDRPQGVDLSNDPSWLRGRVIKSNEGQDLAPGDESDIFYIKLSDEFMNISKYFMPSMHTKGNIETLLSSTRVIEPAMNFLRSVRTSKNPAFLPVNLVRDIGTGLFNIEMYVPGSQGEFLRRAPAVLRQLMASQIFRNEDLSSAGKQVWDDTQKKYVPAKEDKYVALAREFIQNGGNQNLHVIDNYDSIANKVAEKLKAINGGEDTAVDKAKKSIGVVSDYLEKANNAAELVSRIAAYSITKEQALKEGKSEAEAIKRAVYVGRNLTVNFNKHGTIGKGMNNLYMFWNASIGGTSQILRAFQSSPKVRAQLLSIAALGFAIPFIMRALMGDEWEKIPDWVKDRNFIIPTGGGNYFTVPLPYGYSWFITSGMNVSEAAYKSQNPLYGFGGAAQWLAIRNIDGLMNNFAPTGASNDMLTLMAPTLADPVLELAMNKDWTGRPIMPEPGMRDYDRESQRFWSNTSPLYTGISGALSSLTGGHNRIDGLVEISPNTLEYIAEFIFGGLGKFVNQTTALGTGKVDDVSDIPIIRSFAGSTSGEISVASDYASLQNRVKRVERSIDDARKSSNYDMVADLERRYAFEVDLINTFKAAERQIERQQSIRRAIEGKYRESNAQRNEDDRQRLDEIKQKIKEIKSSAISAVAAKR